METAQWGRDRSVLTTGAAGKPSSPAKIRQVTGQPVAQERSAPQPARAASAASQLPTWQLDRSATATWRAIHQPQPQDNTGEVIICDRCLGSGKHGIVLQVTVMHCTSSCFQYDWQCVQSQVRALTASDDLITA